MKASHKGAKAQRSDQRLFCFAPLRLCERYGWIAAALLIALVCSTSTAQASPPALSIATFQIDVTPPIGSPLCSAEVAPAVGVDDPLSARGIILLPAEQTPIVLLALDWVGTSNEGHDRWRKEIAAAVQTSADRVAVHTLHQHDTPGCDFTAERIATENGLAGKLFDPQFAKQSIQRAAAAARAALAHAKPITHLAIGKAKVEKVASTRRCLGPDGKVARVRWTTCTDPELRAYPEGTIDPFTKVVGFFHDDVPVVLLTYYATHPQSYYGKGRISADFVGMARSQREQALSGPMQIHFNGAGGNLGAGKYNDGSPENRPILAGRLATGMAKAWEAAERFPIDGATIRWDTREVALPPAGHLDQQQLQSDAADERLPEDQRLGAVRHLAWLQRCEAGHKITIARLRIGLVDILHLPGELFVEYQLAAQTMRPDSLVCMAAYGDGGPGYIGLTTSYTEGGYETGPNASLVAPRVETILMRAIAELME